MRLNFKTTLNLLGFTSENTKRGDKTIRLYKGVREVVDEEEVNSFVGPQFIMTP